MKKIYLNQKQLNGIIKETANKLPPFSLDPSLKQNSGNLNSAMAATKPQLASSGLNPKDVTYTFDGENVNPLEESNDKMDEIVDDLRSTASDDIDDYKNLSEMRKKIAESVNRVTGKKATVKQVNEVLDRLNSGKLFEYRVYTKKELLNSI